MSTGYSPLRALFMVAPSLHRAGAHAMTVYMPLRSEGYDARYYEIVRRDLFERYRERLGQADVVVMTRELARLCAHLAILRPAGSPALACFADEAADLLQLIRLPASTPERLEIGEPLLAPALRQLEEFPPALIVVVDKERLKLFGAILDELVDLDGHLGIEVRHSRAGGSSAPSSQRKAENRARFNLKAAVTAVEHAMGTGAFPQVWLAGPEEARSEFEALLPHPLRRSLAGHLTASLDSATLVADLRRQVDLLRV